MSGLSDWQDFYVITGGAAAALTGLVFVVVSLVSPRVRGAAGARDGFRTFSTSTIVHFCVAFVVSAVLCSPWPHAAIASAIIGAIGAIGLFHTIYTWRRGLVVAPSYQPLIEDWIWYQILPALTYFAIAASGIVLPAAQPASFVLGGGIVLLIFVGIHNAWDLVNYFAIERPQAEEAEAKTPPAAR